ncbi:TPA: YfhO family protein [Candidatus Woesearchaeota archaeon]|nr:YfhO family protein [Candidatus Woesearchaeota archaeon]HII68357.1 YfhO family protein [Candidatus Woesearchaeota archaeon]
MDNRDWIVIGILFAVSFFFWTLPLQDNHLPFSEHDGAYIFSYGDHITYLGRTMNLIGDTPPSLGGWYAGYNILLGPRGIVYPPAYNIDYSLMQIFGGERIVPVFLFIAFTSILGCISMYVVMRKLFGFLPAILTAIPLMFSFREIMSYLWGQRHNTFAFVFIPLTAYSLYMALAAFYGDEKKKHLAYLWLYMLLLASSSLAHFSATAFLVIYSLIVIAFFFIAYRKLPALPSLWKQYLAMLGVFFFLTWMMYPIYFSGLGGDSGENPSVMAVATLFTWIDRPANNFGLNPAFSEYATSYPGYWTIGLLMVGIALLLFSKGTKKYFLLSGMVALYLVYHFPFFGLSTPDNYRIARFMMIEPYFFYAIMGVAIASLPRFIPLAKRGQQVASYALAIAFLAVVISTQGMQAYATLEQSYDGISRITPAQMELASWIESNVPAAEGVNILGTISYPKWRWIQILSRHYATQSYEHIGRYETVAEVKGWEPINSTFTHVAFDYSDLAAMGRADQIQQLQQLESQAAQNASIVYQTQLIRVYRYG